MEAFFTSAVKSAISVGISYAVSVVANLTTPRAEDSRAPILIVLGVCFVVSIALNGVAPPSGGRTRRADPLVLALVGFVIAIASIGGVVLIKVAH